jgi:hypothetical protein
MTSTPAVRALALLGAGAVALRLAPPAQVLSAAQAEVGRAILAAVVDQRGRPMVNLDLDDFVIVENGEPREVLGVHVADYPVALLIDNSASAEADLDAIKSAAARMVPRIGERRLAIGTLADDTGPVYAPDDERADPLGQIDRVSTNPDRAASPFAAAARAVRAITADAPPFSAIIIVSARPTEREEVPDDLMSAILESRTIVHVVAHRPGVAGGGEMVDRLDNLAQRTGGLYTPIYSAASYLAALDRVADRLSTEMIVQYLVPAGGRPAGFRQDVRIGVSIPGARVSGLGVSR